MHISHKFLISTSSRYGPWPWAQCTCQCIYLMLSVGNVHVTVKNHESGVSGRRFTPCSKGRGVLLRARRARRCCFASRCPKNKAARGQEVRAQQQNGMFLPGWGSSLRSQRAQRPPTRTPCMFLPTSLHFHLPGSLIEAYLATDYVLCRSECG